MIELANRPDWRRQDLFRKTSRKIGVHEAIIEKDFWVCLILRIPGLTQDYRSMGAMFFHEEPSFDAMEALREYIRRDKKNIPKLLEYAEKLNVLGPLKRALEVLV